MWDFNCAYLILTAITQLCFFYISGVLIKVLSKFVMEMQLMTDWVNHKIILKCVLIKELLEQGNTQPAVFLCGV